MPALFRRRLLWVPTWRGLLVFVAFAAIAIVTAARHAGGFLQFDEPARGPDGRGARLLVVEGWLDDGDLDAAIAAYRRGRYERLVTSGGPIESWREIQPWPTYADRAADYLRRHGLADAAIATAPAPETRKDRTFLSALKVREWAERAGLARGEAIDIYSASVHARRSRGVYRMAFGGDIEVGVLAAPARRYDVEHWWTTSEGVKTVLDEAVSLAWTACCFWPPVAPPWPARSTSASSLG